MADSRRAFSRFQCELAESDSLSETCMHAYFTDRHDELRGLRGSCAQGLEDTKRLNANVDTRTSTRDRLDSDHGGTWSR